MCPRLYSDGSIEVVRFFASHLKYSRYVDVQVVENERQETVIRSLLRAFYPQDGQLNLAVNKYSDGLRRRVAEEASKVSFSETSATISATTGGSIGKRQCEEVVVNVAQDFDAFYEQRQPETAESPADLLVLSSDGKGISSASGPTASTRVGDAGRWRTPSIRLCSGIGPNARGANHHHP